MWPSEVTLWASGIIYISSNLTHSMPSLTPKPETKAWLTLINHSLANKATHLTYFAARRCQWDSNSRMQVVVRQMMPPTMHRNASVHSAGSCGQMHISGRLWMIWQCWVRPSRIFPVKTKTGYLNASTHIHTHTHTHTDVLPKVHASSAHWYMIQTQLPNKFGNP